METNSTSGLVLAKRGTYFAPYTNADLTEGRGQEFPIVFCEKKSTALRLAKGNYVMGTDCEVKEITAYTINGILYAPIGKIVKPTTEDLALEKALTEREQIESIKVKFLAGAELTYPERELLAKQLK